MITWFSKNWVSYRQSVRERSLAKTVKQQTQQMSDLRSREKFLQEDIEKRDSEIRVLQESVKFLSAANAANLQQVENMSNVYRAESNGEHELNAHSNRFS